MYPKPRPYLSPLRKRLPGERRAVTIGIGFSCSDGIVLCADRQMTGAGGFKFEQSKISGGGRDHWMILFTYAGDPDAAKVMLRKTCRQITAEMRKAKSDFKTIQAEKARAALEKIFADKHTKGLQTLIGIRFDTSECYLFKTNERKVVEGFTEYIGGGDSSALRYLCDFLFTGQVRDFTVDEASVIGSYIVSVANRYIDGCSGGPDVTSIRKSDGSVTDNSGGVFPAQKISFSYCEEQIGKGLRELLWSGGTKEIVVQASSRPDNKAS